MKKCNLCGSHMKYDETLDSYYCGECGASDATTCNWTRYSYGDLKTSSEESKIQSLVSSPSNRRVPQEVK